MIKMPPYKLFCPDPFICLVKTDTKYDTLVHGIKEGWVYTTVTKKLS